jgi:hypothetical protein
MYALEVLASAFVAAQIFGRFAYLIFLDLRWKFPWIFGHAADSHSEQVRLLTYCAVATMADSMFAVANGYMPFKAIVLTPFAFVWIAEIVLSVNRLFGPVFEKFIVDWHPVDIIYSGMKKAASRQWSPPLPLLPPGAVPKNNPGVSEDGEI